MADSEDAYQAVAPFCIGLADDLVPEGVPENADGSHFGKFVAEDGRPVL